jgi:hypothetical protein
MVTAKSCWYFWLEHCVQQYRHRANLWGGSSNTVTHISARIYAGNVWWNVNITNNFYRKQKITFRLRGQWWKHGKWLIRLTAVQKHSRRLCSCMFHWQATNFWTSWVHQLKYGQRSKLWQRLVLLMRFYLRCLITCKTNTLITQSCVGWTLQPMKFSRQSRSIWVIKLTKQSQRTHSTAPEIFHLRACRLYLIHAQLQKVMTFNDTQTLRHQLCIWLNRHCSS